MMKGNKLNMKKNRNYIQKKKPHLKKNQVS